MKAEPCLAVLAAALAIATPAETQEAFVAERWVGLVERHEPGVLDEPMLAIADLDGPALARVLHELRSLFRRWHDVERQNRLLLAAATAHADIAILAPERAARLVSIGPGEPPWRAVRGLDGEHTGTDLLTAHGEVARRLLDRVEPDPSASAGARLWYQAMAAYFVNELLLADATWHLERARSVFPEDALLLMFSGAMHEAFASPLYQRTLEDLGRRPHQSGLLWAGPGLRNPKVPGSETEELLHAERYLRSALKADPLLVEARIRLGRVLGRRGRHRESAGELNAAMTQVKEPLLRYYALLFLGAEEAALGHLDVARGCFERAAALYETAHAPLIAMSDLAQHAGDPVAARRAVRLIAALPGNPDEREDPWWVYHRAAGRQHHELLAALRTLVRSGRTADAGAKADPK